MLKRECRHVILNENKLSLSRQLKLSPYPSNSLFSPSICINSLYVSSSIVTYSTYFFLKLLIKFMPFSVPQFFLLL